MRTYLQECPTSGRLLAEQINLVPRPQRKTKSAEALKKANDDAVLIAAVARIFWSERRYPLSSLHTHFVKWPLK